MDTLSRKHRLRQQQIAAKTNQQQQVFYSKENQQQQKQPFEGNFKRITAPTILSPNNNNNFDDDSEQFRVFRVVERRSGSSEQYTCSSHRQQNSSNNYRTPTKASFTDKANPTDNKIQPREVERRNNEQYDENANQTYRDLYERAPTQVSGRQVTDHTRPSYAGAISNTSDCSNGSSSTTRSTGDSSGFQSESSQSSVATGCDNKQSRARCHQRNGTSSYANSREHQTRSRCKVIDDLERLMSADTQEPRNLMSPAESIISSYADGSTLSRNNLNDGGYDYSTLCRDEFSSFIAVENTRTQTPTIKRSRQILSAPDAVSGGPMLIGVHEGSSSNDSDSCCAMAIVQSPSSASSTLSSSPDHASNRLFVDKLSCQADNQTPSPSSSQNSAGHKFLPADELACSVEQPQDDLSRMLDVYLDRVDILLRLSAGDQTVSIGEAFGRDDGSDEICVGSEHRTEVLVCPLKHDKPAAKVVQEIIMRTSGDEDDEYAGESAAIKLVATTTSDFRSILNAPQVSAELDWNALTTADDLKQKEPSEINYAKLEESLLGRFYDNVNQKPSNSDCGARRSSDDYQHRARQFAATTVKRHLSEFIEGYLNYQTELQSKTSFATDWHQNWLFAYKRQQSETESPGDQADKALFGCSNAAKRAKLTGQQVVYSQATNNLDLIKYSTLILSKCKPPKLTYLTENHHYAEIEQFYEAQEERSRELYTSAIESNGQVDLCRLMMDDNFDCDSEITKDSKRGFLLNISYSSSLTQAQCNLNNRFQFAAYGYQFETPISTLISSTKRLLQVKQRILEKSLEMFASGQSTVNLAMKQSIRLSGEQQVRFLINLTNVELINKLPVIQFCAKISGALPISVRWFKCGQSRTTQQQATVEEDIELSSTVGGRKKQHHLRWRKRELGCETVNGQSWPVEMHANYDFEYQNEWLSWFRFKRSQGDILFEIRDANSNEDYNQTYKCVIENYCSRRECTFSLSSKQRLDKPFRQQQPTELGNTNQQVSIKKRARRSQAAASAEPAGHALLRTWSQRTLHKPQAQQVNDTKQQQQQTGDSKSKSWQQTVGRRSALVASLEADEDKFGKDFPYHPENLLKRLEENKFSIPLNSKLRLRHNLQPQQEQQVVDICSRQQDELPSSQSSTVNCCRQTHQQQVSQEIDREQLNVADQSCSQQPELTELPLEVKASAKPKPRPRLKEKQTGRQQVAQVGSSNGDCSSDLAHLRSTKNADCSRSTELPGRAEADCNVCASDEPNQQQTTVCPSEQTMQPTDATFCCQQEPLKAAGDLDQAQAKSSSVYAGSECETTTAPKRSVKSLISRFSLAS